MTRSRTALIAGLATILSTALVFSQGQTLKIPKAPAGRAPHGKLLFALTTGYEDLQTANMALKQLKLAKEAGYLEDITVVAYGRGVQLFDNTKARPEQTAQFIREAQAAGIRFHVCNNALNTLGIPVSRLDPKPDEIVPFGIVKVSQLVSDGYQVIRY
jgi:intracellular sulfur oxidation DsrE/DsrF family protein